MAEKIWTRDAHRVFMGMVYLGVTEVALCHSCTEGSFKPFASIVLWGISAGGCQIHCARVQPCEGKNWVAEAAEKLVGKQGTALKEKK